MDWRNLFGGGNIEDRCGGGGLFGGGFVVGGGIGGLILVFIVYFFGIDFSVVIGGGQ